jgi:phytoene dehydrogenase-like protein
MDKHFDAIVVGAGPGGSAAAALLAKEGKKVLLVDKNKSAGGRMMTIHDKEGFHYELFPINGCPAEGAQMDHVLEIIGKADAVKRIKPKELGLEDVMYLMDGKGELRANNMGGMDERLLHSLRISLFNPKHVVGINRMKKLFQAIMTMPEEEVDKLCNTPAEKFVDSYGPFPGMFRTYVLFQCEGAFEMTCDKVPAADFIRFIRQTSAQGAGRYYEYGIGRVFEIYAETVEELGGTVLFSTRVKSIDVEDGTAKGITLQNGDQYTANLVISDAGIRQTVCHLVGEDKFEPAYVDRIKSLLPNLACVGYRWFLDTPVLKSPMIVVFPEGGLYTWDEFKAMSEGKIDNIHNYVYFGTTSLYPNTAPEGKQLVYAVMSCYPNPEMDPKPMLNYIEGIVRKIQPDLFDHIYRTEIMSVAQSAAVGTEKMAPDFGGEAYGVANAVGQSGEQRPSAKSPIKNLYYVGNDAGGWGMGTNQAVDSAVNVTNMILER